MGEIAKSSPKRQGCWEEKNWGHFCNLSAAIRMRLFEGHLSEVSPQSTPTNQTSSLQSTLPLEFGEKENLVASKIMME